MAYRGITYPKLRVKMAEVNIGVVEMAEGIGMNRETLSRKLSGRVYLTLPEAQKIRDKYFPGITIDDLFVREVATA